jgi:hypothetical protein
LGLFDAMCILFQRCIHLLSIVPHTVSPRRTTVHDGHHVLPHFRFGRQPFLGEHQHCAAMGVGVMFEPLNAETGEAVPVREDQHRDVPSPDLVHTGQQPLARDVQPAAHFLDTLDPRQSLRHHERFQHLALIRQVRLLCCTRYPTGGDQLGWRMVRLPQTDELTDLRLRGETAVAVRSGDRNQPSFAFPTLQRLDRDTKECCGFPCAHGVFREIHYRVLEVKLESGSERNKKVL